MSIFALRSNGLASSAYKNLSSTQSSLNANIGRLSSGLRINSTADDSAGSNISVRMSNQVRGMSQANRNAQDANNLLATAESGLSDISDIVSKMRELAVQASTDTLNDNDRSSIDLEFQSLKDELTRISNVTEYNGMNVLNGTYQQAGGVLIANSSPAAYTTDGTAASAETWSGSGPESLYNATQGNGDVGDLAAYDQSQPGTSGSSAPHGDAGGSAVNLDGPKDNIRGHWRIQIGADNDINNQHEFSITNASAKGLDLETDDVTTVDKARIAITALDHATDELNRERSYIGSEQNKLQFTMSNLSSNIQSIESARSSIEDVDFAAEAADLAKNQILAQSGTAMLAQASAISQNILGLLA
jgi:flagellin